MPRKPGMCFGCGNDFGMSEPIVRATKPLCMRCVRDYDDIGKGARTSPNKGVGFEALLALYDNSLSPKKVKDHHFYLASENGPLCKGKGEVAPICTDDVESVTCDACQWILAEQASEKKAAKEIGLPDGHPGMGFFATAGDRASYLSLLLCEHLGDGGDHPERISDAAGELATLLGNEEKAVECSVYARQKVEIKTEYIVKTHHDGKEKVCDSISEVAEWLKYSFREDA